MTIPRDCLRSGSRARAGEATCADRDPSDFVTLFFTSGTTGKPKGAPQDHDFINHLAHSWVIACRYTRRRSSW